MSERPAPHVWAYAVATSWAILPERLPAIFEIAARENLDLEAVAAKLGRPLDNARAATVRDGIAVIPVEGTIFPRASLFAQISGGVAADEIARDLRAALDDPGVAGIVLNVDSPGGDVNGVAEVAAMIHAARDRKPIPPSRRRAASSSSAASRP
jgi:ClpP class serine protease